jgi:E3 ubiquitin-protein ligase TRIP12
MVELLLNKMSSVYLRSFHREGVIFEVCKISEEALSPAFVKSRQPPAEVEEVDVKKEPDDQASPAPVPAQSSTTTVSSNGATLGVTIGMEEDRKPAEETLADLAALRALVLASSTPKRISSTPTDPQDINILRARILRVKKGLDIEAHPGEAAEGLDRIRQLVLTLQDSACTEDKLRDTLSEIASLFQVHDDGDQLSSFELLHSGLLQGLLDFVTSDGEGEGD